ncbi:hypothetical protein DsansV1_C05g0052651 [Dioscorea sansibarensis]
MATIYHNSFPGAAPPYISFTMRLAEEQMLLPLDGSKFWSSS